MMLVWRKCQAISEQTGDSSAFLPNYVNIIVNIIVNSVSFIFHISVRINFNRIDDGLLYSIPDFNAWHKVTGIRPDANCKCCVVMSCFLQHLPLAVATRFRSSTVAAYRLTGWGPHSRRGTDRRLPSAKWLWGPFNRHLLPGREGGKAPCAWNWPLTPGVRMHDA
jgi:hypothetical protein